jgi:enoyl-CoA hydratase/carnithine racemase
VTTISLVQGECLGGGFEAALSSDVIVAERGARFGFPEILFNLFPGMGAYSFLERKIGQKAAEDVLTSGKIYSAEEMHALGVVDVLAEDGEGEAAIAALIKRRQRSRNGMAALAAVRRRVHRIDFSELLDIVQIWVDAALRLNPRDLKLMQRLVSRQNDLGESQQAHKKIEAGSAGKASADDQSKSVASGKTEAAVGDGQTIDAGGEFGLRAENNMDASAAQGNTDENVGAGVALNHSEATTQASVAATVTVNAKTGDVALRAENTTDAQVEAQANTKDAAITRVDVSAGPNIAASNDTLTVLDGTLTGNANVAQDADGSHAVNTRAEGSGAARDGARVGGALPITVADNVTEVGVGAGTKLVAICKVEAGTDHQGSSTTVATGDATRTSTAAYAVLGFVDDRRRRRRRATFMRAER